MAAAVRKVCESSTAAAAGGWRGCKKWRRQHEDGAAENWRRRCEGGAAVVLPRPGEDGPAAVRQWHEDGTAVREVWLRHGSSGKRSARQRCGNGTAVLSSG